MKLTNKLNNKNCQFFRLSKYKRKKILIPEFYQEIQILDPFEYLISIFLDVFSIF